MADPEDRTNPHTSSPGVTSSNSGASGSTGTYNSGSSSTGSSAHQSETKEKGRETANEVKKAARMKAEGMFDQQKWVAADQAEKLSTVFRNMAKDFDEQDQSYFSGYASNIARCTDAVSQRLREQDLSSLMGQVQSYSRRQPAVFLGGAIAAGFFLARFLNSSQERKATNASQTDKSVTSSSPTTQSSTMTSSTATGSMDTSAY